MSTFVRTEFPTYQSKGTSDEEIGSSGNETGPNRTMGSFCRKEGLTPRENHLTTTA